MFAGVPILGMPPGVLVRLASQMSVPGGPGGSGPEDLDSGGASELHAASPSARANTGTKRTLLGPSLHRGDQGRAAPWRAAAPERESKEAGPKPLQFLSGRTERAALGQVEEIPLSTHADQRVPG